ncbi:hypothetical protein B0T49_13575 [Chromobacterium violaceum]|uniref:hypothetical protein n=1 Tax=Chromobacterium violaceum TaxID=536 RepID=UPI0009D9E1F9|nr:hypothetical protein [Chromobacterium violaceum]MBP4050882.1 hypothetical protein [Chromobacterium violaceum]OQS21171.1 hypothetical protein B0T41_21140 [Chromobacterium violaceum]OQS46713.1 hypothetical protein B0T48_14785 [Chromobacterium violaceum]OQS49359.1 hypothetical protein B0T49_13575 [Chromobacterium violaceum]
MNSWRPFSYQETTYDLSHLYPKVIDVVQPATGDKPARTYKVQLIYSLHTFTRGVEAREKPDEQLLYCDSRECRVFDFQRYDLSKRLPEIVEGLQARKCYHSGKGNFFVVELAEADGSQVEYEVYFEASRSSRKGVLNLFVQSAYVRDEAHRGGRPKKKPIGFYTLLFNTQTGKAIKPPM